MAARPKKTAILTRDELEKDIHRFKNKGGKIEKIPSGVTGMHPHKGQKQIVITQSKN